jgi:NO-binding membrane sensor protein with MHYT domain
MNSVVLTSYQSLLVVLSVLISVVGSFVALTAATRVRDNGKLSFTNILSAGIALGGIGVWAMHFVGMVSLKLDVASSYSMLETVISLVAAVVATSLALAFVAKAPQQLGRMLGAGALLGMGVVFMHYLGMYGLKFGGYIQWDYGIVGVSVAIAIVAATAALWLAFNTKGVLSRVLAALVMGAAVCSMHYTGMAAADFICTTPNRNAYPQGVGYVTSLNLSSVVAIMAFGMAFLISIDQFFQRAGAAARSAAARSTTRPAAAGRRS